MITEEKPKDDVKETLAKFKEQKVEKKPEKTEEEIFLEKRQEMLEFATEKEPEEVLEYCVNGNDIRTCAKLWGEYVSIVVSRNVAQVVKREEEQKFLGAIEYIKSVVMR